MFPIYPLPCLQLVGYLWHHLLLEYRILAFLLLLAIILEQEDGLAREHPHPENSSRATDADGGRHTSQVAGTDSAAKATTKAWKEEVSHIFDTFFVQSYTFSALGAILHVIKTRNLSFIN